MTKNNGVALKGNKEGIAIFLNEEMEFDVLKEHLIHKLESSKLFFQGAKVTNIQGKMLSQDEKAEIKHIINSQFGMTMEEKNHSEINQIPLSKKKDDTNEGVTKFIRATIRSGQCLKYEGNLIIIGDVNPGAEVIADGNILVMGALRGMAHAGAKGNEKAFVVAFTLLPTQLRIANIISRPPDNDNIMPLVPEIAMVKNDSVVIEPYLPKK